MIYCLITLIPKETRNAASSRGDFMSQTTRPLLFNANESRRLGYKNHLVEVGVCPVATARQEYQIDKPEGSRKGG